MDSSVREVFKIKGPGVGRTSHRNNRCKRIVYLGLKLGDSSEINRKGKKYKIF